MTETAAPLYITDISAPQGRRRVGEFHYDDSAKSWMVFRDQEHELIAIVKDGKFWDLFTQSVFTSANGGIIDVTIMPRPFVPAELQGEDKTINQVRKEAGLSPLPEEKRWVLVKGWHDSGNVDAVYGPYEEKYVDWLLSNLLDNSTQNWMKVQLESGP